MLSRFFDAQPMAAVAKAKAPPIVAVVLPNPQEGGVEYAVPKAPPPGIGVLVAGAIYKAPPAAYDPAQLGNPQAPLGR